jgi:hypothetical protein
VASLFSLTNAKMGMEIDFELPFSSHLANSILVMMMMIMMILVHWW